MGPKGEPDTWTNWSTGRRRKINSTLLRTRVRIVLRLTISRPEPITAAFADDTAIITTDSDPVTALQKLQTDPLAIQNWFKKWRAEGNESKSIHITFTTRRAMYSPIHINNVHTTSTSDIGTVEHSSVHPDNMRLRRHLPNDLPIKFLM
jgi:hypothetical protein